MNTGWINLKSMSKWLEVEWPSLLMWKGRISMALLKHKIYTEARSVHVSQLLNVQMSHETDMMSLHSTKPYTVQRNGEHCSEGAKWWRGVLNPDILTTGLSWFTQAYCNELDRYGIYITGSITGRWLLSSLSVIGYTRQLPTMFPAVLLIFWNKGGKALMCFQTQVDLTMSAWGKRRERKHKWEKYRGQKGKCGVSQCSAVLCPGKRTLQYAAQTHQLIQRTQ